MAVCNFPGNSDMYGLGIRLGYYLQWFAAIAAMWIAKNEVEGLRFSIDIFVTATFLALILLRAGDVDSLEPAETYIVLLLMFGLHLALVPIYLWRLVTRGNPLWDPTRYPISDPGRLAANMKLMLLIGVLVYQYWFWFTRVPSLNNRDCQQYGFLFARVPLNSKTSVVLNALLYAFLGLILLYLIMVKIRAFISGVKEEKDIQPMSSRAEKHLKRRIRLLQNIDGWMKLIVAITVTTATELTISWNGITEINTLADAGQAIPFIVGVASVLRVVYVYFFPKYEDIAAGGNEYHERKDRHPNRSPRRSGGIIRPIDAHQLVGVAAAVD